MRLSNFLPRAEVLESRGKKGGGAGAVAAAARFNVGAGMLLAPARGKEKAAAAV